MIFVPGGADLLNIVAKIDGGSRETRATLNFDPGRGAAPKSRLLRVVVLTAFGRRLRLPHKRGPTHEPFECFFGASRLQQKRTQIVEALDIVRLEANRLAKRGFGLRPASQLVQRHALIVASLE